MKKKIYQIPGFGVIAPYLLYMGGWYVYPSGGNSDRWYGTLGGGNYTDTNFNIVEVEHYK